MRDAEFQYYQNHSPSLAEDPPASTIVEGFVSKPSMLVDLDAHRHLTNCPFLEESIID